MSLIVAWPSPGHPAADLDACYPRFTRPTLRVNFIASVDGAVTVDGVSGGLHGPGDKEIFDVLRRSCDALIAWDEASFHEGRHRRSG